MSTYMLSDKLSEIGWHIGANAITRLEVGDRNISVDDLVALAAALGCKPETLLSSLTWQLVEEHPQGAV